MLLTMLLACTPSEGPLGLNELGADGLIEADGAEHPWAEVYNATDEPASLAGWTVGVDDEVWTLPALEVPAQGFLVLSFSGDPERGADHAPFTLPADGARVEVGDDEGVLRQEIELPALDEATSYGRRPDGLANWQIIDEPSPGALNGE